MTNQEFLTSFVNKIIHREGILDGKNQIKQEIFRVLQENKEEFKKVPKILEQFVEIIETDFLVFEIENNSLKEDLEIANNFLEKMTKKNSFNKKYENNSRV